MNQPLPLPLPLRPTFGATKLLMTRGPDEALKAILCPAHSAHPQVAQSLCEALALGFQQPVSVVLCAGNWASSSALPRCDDLGLGKETLHSEATVVESPPRRGRRLKGLGALGPLRQLGLRGVL
jgi:hypothetical protein